MRILHISCGFPYSSVYKNFFNKLYEKEIKFDVYIPQHKKNYINLDEFNFNYYTSRVITSLDRIFYFKKIYKMKKDLENNIDISQTNFIHAHSLFTDGGVAYLLNKKHNIPFCVAIRDTDINKYFKMAIHLRNFAQKILNAANAVVFLSNSYKERLFKKYLSNDMQKKINKKIYVIPNGIGQFWLNNINLNPVNLNSENELRILFVGQIIKRKNITTVLEVAKYLKEKKHKTVSVTLIGKKVDKVYFKKIQSIMEFEYIPHINQTELIDYYKSSHVFIMPSLTETFGLVYGEAMSQGLPVIFSKGEGFDQQFDDGTIGYAVNPLNVQEIAERVIDILNNEKIRKNCIKQVGKFDWDRITEKYLSLYKKTSRR